MPRGGSASQIYGTINANNGGNIYVVNPNGVQIGKSAQINVGSLYVSNKDLDKVDFNNFKTVQGIINDQNAQRTNAELMSLGNINANTVTFEGDRVIIDVDRVKTLDENNKPQQIAAKDLIVNTTDKSNVVIGYSGYDDENNTYADKNDTTAIATVNNTAYTKKDGYMWVKNLEQLQAMNTNLGGNYALNNSIDAIPTKDWNNGAGFESIGNDDPTGKGFQGKFDGLNNEIFGLTVNRGENAGLFGKTEGATIKNTILINGSVKGTTNVGAFVGSANNTKIENVVNSAHVSGTTNVGGIAGSVTGKSTITDAGNTSTVQGHANVGGIAGSLVGSDVNKATINGSSYNFGAVYGTDDDGNIETTTNLADIQDNKSNNIGGVAGYAENAVLGSDDDRIRNDLTVKGGYNVGGIVGSMTGTTVKNADNSGNITAVGYTKENYIYHGGDAYSDAKNQSIADVNIANVGGIAGSAADNSEIAGAVNTGDIQSTEITNNNDTFHAAGNVGGIAGRAENTNISNAENKENEIRGAHNVGGIAGYFGGSWGDKADKPAYTISGSINNGGDIMATGARDGNFAAKEENVRTGSGDAVIIGNMGGIAGYMYGDNTQIKDSANRGTVHSKDIEDAKNIQDSSKAANAGGVVGKIDRKNTIDIDKLKADADKAAVVDSYNTGSVQGFANLGGVAGMMFNGEIARSYNAGNIRSTRKAQSSLANLTPVNMGGIVGETTEQIKSAYVSLYDVYNRGDIGDKNFEYGARHVGGIAGRLSGSIDTAYNKGNIYNNMTVTGGIAGLWTGTDRNASINNSFNAGNITVYNKDHTTNEYVSLGGIVGSTSQRPANSNTDKTLKISNVYNLGTLRSFNTEGSTGQSLGGIVGTVNHYTKNLSIENVYTTGELYTADVDNNGKVTATNEGKSIYGFNNKNAYGNPSYWNPADNIKNAYYIEPTSDQFTNLADKKNTGDLATDNQAKVVKNNVDKDSDGIKDRSDADSYGGFTFSDPAAGNTTENSWRIYNGTTPILNAFLPKLAKDDTNSNMQNNAANINKVQYGNAYNPFATIIDAKNNSTIEINDKNSGAIGNVDSIIVKNGSLTVNNLTNKVDDTANVGNTMYNGTLYADGDLKLSGNNVRLGSISNLYGSTITIDSTGEMKSHGNIISTGANGNNGVSIKAIGGDVEILGNVKSAASGEKTVIEGMNNSIVDTNRTFAKDSVSDYNQAMPNVSTQYDFTKESTANGDINITAAKDKNGNGGDVNVLYGNLGKGYINSSKDVNITAENGKIYSDADMTVDNGDINLQSQGEAVLDISNIGKHKGTDKDGNISNQNQYLHEFLGKFQNTEAETDHKISFANKDDSMIAIDMWDKDKGKFDLNKYDFNKDKDITLANDLKNLNAGGVTPFIWVADADQLVGIQQYANEYGKDTNILSYAFAMKNNIDTSQVQNYESIGKKNKNGNQKDFTGIFDGRGNSIIGATSSPEPLFDTISKNANGEGGTVKDLSLVSANVDDAGSGHAIIANTNNGTIDGVTTFGNDVNSKATDGEDSIGGIVGINNGTIKNSKSMNIIRHSSLDQTSTDKSYLGGIAGINNGTIINSDANSAVTSDISLGGNSAIGGVVGKNDTNGKIENVVSRGVTTGLYKNQDGKYKTAGNVGGIAGINNSSITGINNSSIKNAYNESITSGMNNVGGIVGANSGSVENIANASWVYGGDNVGGIAGTNSSNLTNGRNSAEITGDMGIKSDDNTTTSGGTNVGGLVGVSGENSEMKNLTNDESGTIKGHTNVGGLVGLNQGTLTGGDLGSLRNRADVIGVQNVGGTAGSNSGIIANVDNDVQSSLKVNTDYKDKNGNPVTGNSFGGVTGVNAKGENNKYGIVYNVSNSIGVQVDNATNIGGIIGRNDGIVLGNIINNADVKGTNSSGVGGVIGKNNAEIEINSKKFQDAISILQNKENIGIDDKKAEVSLVNKGKVEGTNNVGGAIGINDKDIANTNVINTTAGTVKGETNVGGIIGTNNASVEGGRDANKNYYKYHVINNGKVEGTTNVGGLVGENSRKDDKIGSLTAAYNTGSVTGKNNVGGVAGSNSGSIDQVFSDTKSVSSTDKTGVVGGVVGDNSNGTLTNAYSIGTNLKAAGSGETGSNTFSWKDEDEAKNVNVSGDNNIWKNQTGLAAPMLKMFLTKLVYHQKDGAVADFPYDGDTRGFTVKLNEKKNIVEVYKQGADGEEPEMIGYLAAADGDGVHSLKDYFATVTKTDAGELVPSDTDLIGTNSQNNIGKYDMFFSHQINKNNKEDADNPNNLGYEFVQGKSYPDDPNDPKNPGNNTPKFEITGNPEWEEDIDRWNYLHDDDPWSRKRNFRERKAEFNYQDGGTKVDADKEDAASNDNDSDESKD